METRDPLAKFLKVVTPTQPSESGWYTTNGKPLTNEELAQMDRELTGASKVGNTLIPRKGGGPLEGKHG